MIFRPQILLRSRIFHLTVAFAWTAMIFAFTLSVGVGLVFGIWPAMRASRVNPVEALQRE